MPLATALAGHADLSKFRKIAKDFVAGYVNDDGSARRFSDPPVIAGCTSASQAAINLATCVKSLTTLLARFEPVKSDRLAPCPLDDKTDPECLTTLKVESKQDGDVFPAVIDGRGVRPQQGLFVRPPVRAQLTICRKASADEIPAPAVIAVPAPVPAPGPPPAICAPGVKGLVKDDKILAPQFGQLRFFRLVNEMFSNNGLMLSLTKDGAIEKFQYASSKSIAQGVTAAAADAATQAAAFDKLRRDEALKREDPLAPLQQQIALREAQNKLAAFDADPTPDPLKPIALAKAQADLELARSQRALVDAQAATLTARSIDP